MTWAKFITSFAEAHSLPRTKALRLLRDVFARLVEAVDSDTRLLVSGFGVFEVRVRRGRRIVNPLTKEPMMLGATEELRFRAAKHVKQRLNSRRRP